MRRPTAQPNIPIEPGAMTTRTLQDALAMAYSTNPTLAAERANVRATDENVPAALAGWRRESWRNRRPRRCQEMHLGWLDA